MGFYTSNIVEKFIVEDCRSLTPSLFYSLLTVENLHLYSWLLKKSSARCQIIYKSQYNL